MTVDLAMLLRQDATRRDGKPLLRIPHIGELDRDRYREPVGKQLKECAETVKRLGLLYRWRKCGAPSVLVTWNSDSKLFTNFDIELFCFWLGDKFDLQDSRGMHFGLPARAVGARLWEELLRDEHGLEYVSWDTVTQWRREGR
jgi:hypothetical protein